METMLALFTIGSRNGTIRWMYDRVTNSTFFDSLEEFQGVSLPLANSFHDISIESRGAEDGLKGKKRRFPSGLGKTAPFDPFNANSFHWKVGRHVKRNFQIHVTGEIDIQVDNSGS